MAPFRLMLLKSKQTLGILTV